MNLSNSTRVATRQLVIHRSGAAGQTVTTAKAELNAAGVGVLNYTLPIVGGYETFHAKVVPADDDVAYVGSANMTDYSRHSMELGIGVDGRDARVIASVVRGVEPVARPVGSL